MNQQQAEAIRRFRDTASSATSGDAASVRTMSELVYGELKRIAAAQLRRERAGHTLQPTALVHEAYLSLAGGELGFESRTHFLAVAARAMRQILVHHARSRNAAKRGSGAQRVTFHDDLFATGDDATHVEALHEALEELERADPRKGQIVELRFFGGLTEAETAEALGLSVPTIAREMRVARALLLQHISRTAPAPGGRDQSKS
ncbi:MAG: ECF-type sigma factor [Bryobacterales bacterium]|nr:ECF-type sigma factor [Bryobacterales bacterium]